MTKFNLCDQSLEELTIRKTHVLAESSDLIRSADQRLEISFTKCSFLGKCSSLEVCTNSFGYADGGRGKRCVLVPYC